MKLKVPDLSRLEWNAEGDYRNQSCWVDDDVLDVTYSKPSGERLVNQGELEAIGIRGFTARFTLVPIAVDKLALYGGIIPMRKEELLGKLEEAEVDLRSPKIPTIALKLRVVNGRALNAYPVSLLPTEKEADGFGFGHLPLLEAVGSEEPRLPESNDVDEQLCLFLRSLATGGL